MANVRSDVFEGIRRELTAQGSHLSWLAKKITLGLGLDTEVEALEREEQGDNLLCFKRSKWELPSAIDNPLSVGCNG